MDFEDFDDLLVRGMQSPGANVGVSGLGVGAVTGALVGVPGLGVGRSVGLSVGVTVGGNPPIAAQSDASGSVTSVLKKSQYEMEYSEQI